MIARWIDHDHIQVPMPAYGDDGTKGDGFTVIDATHPTFAEWAAFLVAGGSSRPAGVVR